MGTDATTSGTAAATHAGGSDHGHHAAGSHREHHATGSHHEWDVVEWETLLVVVDDLAGHPLRLIPSLYCKI